MRDFVGRLLKAGLSTVIPFAFGSAVLLLVMQFLLWGLRPTMEPL